MNYFLGIALNVSSACIDYSADIDECTTWQPCDTRPMIGSCANSIGSYSCGCSAHYRLAPNGKTCLGIISSIVTRIRTCNTIVNVDFSYPYRSVIKPLP